ncbi:serine hydrolase domain-containing protein [Micromonospora sp. NPDC049679]|uniref:serine hydrolase domain-containing protein n=1 Tax=Micromonospora sp. NPDC049679 TaxID=3155920 RepID=UPI003408BC57
MAPPDRELGPPTVTPADIRFRQDTLRSGSAAEVGLLPEQVARIRPDAEAYLQPTADHPTYPTYPGAVVLAAKDGVIVEHAAVGTAVRYSAVGPDGQGVELPAEQQIPARPDTIYDLASVSKLFTTVALLQQVERGRVELEAPVARYVPEFAAGGKQDVTVRMLLTHTSGLPADIALWRDYPTPEARFAAALAVPLDAPPRTRYLYSDLGLIALGVLVRRVTGRPLDEVVRDEITTPLGMRETGYNPGPEKRPRIAATEYQPYAGRGMVWGEVHDENAWSLGGVAGHAGVFSTAADLAIFSQMLLNGGSYDGHRVLQEKTVRAALVDYNTDLEAANPEATRGLGFELDKHWYMMGLATPVTFGHTGFTGTSIVIDPLARTFVILLTNRVHPDRAWGGNNPSRQAVARDLAEATPVHPLSGSAWRAEQRDMATVTLTAPLRHPAQDGRLSFGLWYDIEPLADLVRVEISADGGQTWSLLPITLHDKSGRWSADGVVRGYGGRHWWEVTAHLPGGTTDVRWSSTTGDLRGPVDLGHLGGAVHGRGVYVDRIRAKDQSGTLFGEKNGDGDRLIADGWAPART